MSTVDATPQTLDGTTVEQVGLTILSTASSQRIYKTTTTRGKSNMADQNFYIREVSHLIPVIDPRAAILFENHNLGLTFEEISTN